MIYYPLTALVLAGVRKFVVVTNPEAVDAFKSLLGDGSIWDISIDYVAQPEPGGISQCVRLVEQHIKTSHLAVILGDNIFYGQSISNEIRRSCEGMETGAAGVFAYEVADPSRFTVVQVNARFEVVSIEEKPELPKSRYAVPGLYLYDRTVFAHTKDLVPSARGKFEITDVNKIYLSADKLHVRLMGRGIAWLDGGTPDSLFEAGQFMKILEERAGL